MKAIRVKYLSRTETKPARLRAFDSDRNSVTIPWDKPHPCSDRWESAQKRFRDAAIALCHKMDWAGTLVEGEDTYGHVFTFAAPETMFRIPPKE